MYSLLVVIYLAFVSLGLPDSLLGASWPIMHQEIGIPLSFMGVITFVISMGTVLSSLFSYKLIQKFGTGTITTVSVFMTAIALLGFSYSRNLIMIFVFSIPYGFGAGAIDAALNNYVASHYSSKHMSWLHCFWGVGTVISPFIMSYALTYWNWSGGYRIISIIQMIIGLVLVLSLKLWKSNEKDNETDSNNDSSSESLGLIQTLKIKGVPSLLIGFFAYCSAEATVMAWSATYLVKAKNIDEATAAAFASMFFIGMTVGRFLGGFIMDKFGDRKMIFMGTIIIFGGVALMLIPIDNNIFSLLGLIIIGLGCAPIYPCIVHSTPYNFGEKNSGAIIGIQMASAYLGATVMSPLYGVIGDSIGFSSMPIYVLLFTILMIIMVENTFKNSTSDL